MTRCPYCDLDETHPGAHKPVEVEPKTSFWRKIHLGHPNFVVEAV
jgi:DNA repair photolyase